MGFDFSTLVTNRTREDVDGLLALTQRVIEGNDAAVVGVALVGIDAIGGALAEFLRAGHRGAYNCSDLNRVTAAMEYLHAELTKYGYATGYRPVEVEPGRTVWEAGDIPTVSQMAGYLANLANLRAVLTLLKDTPQVPPDMDGLTVEEANDIERILADIDYIIERVVKSFVRSNAFSVWSGNRPLPGAESDFGRTWAELDAMDTSWRNWQAASWYLLLYGNLKAEGGVV